MSDSSNRSTALCDSLATVPTAIAKTIFTNPNQDLVPRDSGELLAILYRFMKDSSCRNGNKYPVLEKKLAMRACASSSEGRANGEPFAVVGRSASFDKCDDWARPSLKIAALVPFELLKCEDSMATLVAAAARLESRRRKAMFDEGP